MDFDDDDDDADDKDFGDDEDGSESVTTLVRPHNDAQRLRAAYIEAVENHRRIWRTTSRRYTPPVAYDGGVDPRTGRKYKPQWPTAAAKIRAEGIDPASLVRFEFERWLEPDPPPLVRIGAAEVVTAFRKRVCKTKADIVTSLRAEEAAFRVAVRYASALVPDPRAAVRYALNDLGRSMSAAFRYAAAVLEGFPDVAARWRDAAAAQVAQDPDTYRAVWGAILPADIYSSSYSQVPV